MKHVGVDHEKFNFSVGFPSPRGEMVMKPKMSNDFFSALPASSFRPLAGKW
jgi:hypothetical protein